MRIIWISLVLMLATITIGHGEVIHATQEEINQHRLHESQQPVSPKQGDNSDIKKLDKLDNADKLDKPDKQDKLDKSDKSDKSDIIKVDTFSKINADHQHLDNFSKQFEDINRQFRRLLVFILWGFAVIFSGFALLVGFILWDRQTALENTYEMIRRLEKIEGILREIIKTRV